MGGGVFRRGPGGRRPRGTYRGGVPPIRAGPHGPPEETVSRGASNVALGTAAAAIILIGLLWVLPFPLLLQSLGSLGIAVVAFAVPFLIRFPLATLRTTPDAGLAYLGHRLRAAGFRVSEEEGRLTIRTGPLVLLGLGGGGGTAGAPGARREGRRGRLRGPLPRGHGARGLVRLRPAHGGHGPPRRGRAA